MFLLNFGWNVYFSVCKHQPNTNDIWVWQIIRTRIPIYSGLKIPPNTNMNNIRFENICRILISILISLFCLNYSNTELFAHLWLGRLHFSEVMNYKYKKKHKIHQKCLFSVCTAQSIYIRIAKQSFGIFVMVKQDYSIAISETIHVIVVSLLRGSWPFKLLHPSSIHIPYDGLKTQSYCVGAL